jgi:hypothetical protein
MKKILLCLSVLVLAGCAGVSGSRFDLSGSRFDIAGSRLDKIGALPRPPVEMSNERAVALATRAGQLRAQEETIRVKLATEANRHQRIRYYEALRQLGNERAPIERELIEAGRAPRAVLVPAA